MTKIRLDSDFRFFILRNLIETMKIEKKCFSRDSGYLRDRMTKITYEVETNEDCIISMFNNKVYAHILLLTENLPFVF
ncbi:unnamed protein product [Schistosoma bovis]|nr:unnamed protein product [Schistosoma bovis]